MTGAAILGNGATLELNVDCYGKAESDGRYQSSSDFTNLDSRYFPVNGNLEANGIFQLVLEQFTSRMIRALLPRYPLTATAILGNSAILEFLRTAATGPANLIVESNTGGVNDGEVIVNYGFQTPWRPSGTGVPRAARSARSASSPMRSRTRGPWARRCAASSWTKSSGSSLRSTITACAAFCGESARGSRLAWRRWRRAKSGGAREFFCIVFMRYK